MEDMARRSLAVLRTSRLMTSQEAFDRLSNVRLGAGLGILPGLSAESLNRVTVDQQSGHLDLAAGRFLQGRDELAARATLLRARFGPPAPCGKPLEG